jgi:putative ABC transport system permease protein
MEWLRRAARRLRMLARRESVERAMQAEIEHHIACETADHVRHGMSPAEARRRALVDFGGVESIKEEGRDARGTRMVEDLGGDLRYAARVLRRHPALALGAVLTFTLGIGAASAIFSVVYGVLLRPLPYHRPERLVVVWERNVPQDRDRNVVSVGNFEAWRARAKSFDEVTAVTPISFTLSGGGSPERVVGAEISPAYFRMLGVAPALGRDFEPADASSGLAIILSDAFWKRRFGGDPGVIGRSLPISDQFFTVVGVMPAGFAPPRFGWLGEQQAWFPFVKTAQKISWGRFLLVVARLRGQVSVAHARAEMTAIAAQREKESPENTGWSASVAPLVDEITGTARPTLLVLLGAVALLLAMAVTNVAMLTLSSMRRRSLELAIRRALGATDGRLFRQLFAQSAFVALIGTAVGLLATPIAVRLLVGVLPPDVPRHTDIHVDAPVLLVTISVAGLATLLFGSVAAIKGRRAAVMVQAVQAGGETRASPRTGGAGLVATEIALALALGVLAMLMVRTLARLSSVDLGFEPGGVAVARVALPENRYAAPASQTAFFDRLLAQVRVIQGVRSAGLISTRPFGGLGPATTVADPLVPALPGPSGIVADVRFADAAAFDVLRVPLLAGTLFDRTDAGDGPMRAVISADLARSLWPSGSVVGRRLSVAMYNGITPEIVGVVGQVHLIDARTAPPPVVYLSASRFPSSVRDLIVRVDGEPESVVPSLRSAVATIDRALPLYSVTTLPRLVDTSVASDRFTTLLLSVFGLTSLSLAGVGVFGVFADEVGQRRKELGIRLALGARHSQVVLQIVARALGRATAGITIGTAVAFLFARAMAGLLFGVTPSDTASFAVVAIAVLVIALVATVIPAVQAIRRAPLSALREGH